MRKRTALITGSTSGIGLGIAKAFAGKGYYVVFNGLEENGAEISLLQIGSSLLIFLIPRISFLW